MEEVTEQEEHVEQTPPVKIKFETHMDSQDCKKKLKRCLEERYSLEEENKCKKFKVGDFEFERKPKIVEEEAQPCCNSVEWAKMNEMEKDMRERLADLERKCTEKQLELNNLGKKPKSMDREFPKELLKPAVLEVTKRKLSSPEPSEVLSDSTIEQKMPASKKRKVGRPKKISTPDYCDSTEMIVAKKPKSLVGYLLAAKSRLHSQNRSSSSTPPRYNIEDSPSPKPKLKSHKKKSIKKHKEKKLHSKIRPKLKAEAKLKLFTEDESSNEWSSPDDLELSKLDSNLVEEVKVQKVKDMRCILTAEHLEMERCRVLTAMGGLFYAGVSSAIQAPDIYAITLDGERGNRPHIMSREEILRDAVS